MKYDNNEGNKGDKIHSLPYIQTFAKLAVAILKNIKQNR